MDNAEVLTLKIEDLHSGGSQRIQTALAVDDKTVRASHNSRHVIRTGAPTFIHSEIAAIAQSPIRVDIEREHVQAICIVQKERFFIAAERHAIRPLDSINDFDG